jgi:hypothetical protein
MQHNLLQCLLSAALNLGMREVADLIRGEGDADRITESRVAELKILTECAQSVIAEIADEYIPLTRTDNLIAIDGIIFHSEFPQKVTEVTRVQKDGKNIPFRADHEKIIIGYNGKLSVTYVYPPETREDAAQPLEWKNHKINARIIGYGAAAEYCIRTGMTDDAVLWDKRYKDALVAAVRTAREKRIRPRRWI